MARGSVTRVQRKGRNGKPYHRWRAVVPAGIDPATGKRLQATDYFDTNKAAWAWVAEQLAKGPNGISADDAKMTVADLIDRWLILHARSVKPNTMFAVSWAARRAAADLGAIPVASLSVLRVQAFYERLETVPGPSGKLLAPSSIRNVHKVLTMALDLAVDWEILSRNPAKQTKRPAVEKAEIVWWRPEPVNAFLEHTRDDFDGPLWALILSTGMRIGEAIGLNWEDIDIEAGKMTVSRTMTRTANGREVLGTTTKTKSSRRTVVLPLPAQAALKRQLVAQNTRRLEAGELWQDTGAVFDRGDGKRRHMKSARDRFKTIVRDQGLPELTPQGLRHSVVSYLFHLKVPVKLISDLVGHSNTAITLNTYTHIDDTDRGDVARAIEGMFMLQGPDEFVSTEDLDNRVRRLGS